MCINMFSQDRVGLHDVLTRNNRIGVFIPIVDPEINNFPDRVYWFLVGFLN